MDGGGHGRITHYHHRDALGEWTLATCEPHPALRGAIQALWYGEGQISYQRDRILPSLNAYLLINLGPPQYQILPGPPEQRVPFRDIWFSGLHQRPIDTEAPHGNALLGIALHPAGLRPWLSADLRHTGDQVLPLSDLLGDGVLALREALLNRRDLVERFDCVQHWLLQRWRDQRQIDPALQQLLRHIEGSAGQLRLEAAAEALGLSRKHLSRRCLEQTGMTPKALARICRFRAAVSWLQRQDRVPWTDLALRCGYADQAHLIRDFRHFSGLTPGEFLRHAQPDSGSIVIR